jgi:NADH dehydrogenase (ubiquinone) Fe-S protein 6
MSATMLSRRLVHRASQLKVLNRFSSSSANSSTPVPASPSAITNQAPNYPTTWSTSQKPRPVAQSGPRFEQTLLELQPNPLSAMALIENEPIRVVHGRKAVCDGGN